MNELSKERAIIVGVVHSQQKRELVDEYLEELALLLDTAGAEVIKEVIQSRKKFDPAYFVGRGMADQLSQLVSELNADLIVFDDDLTPAQVKNLENKCETKIMDRSGIILDIFSSRAKSHESKTQVELAQLNYYLPRLTKMWTHLSRQTGGAGIGLRGPGETQLEVDRRLVRKRITTLSKDLVKISKRRAIRRKGRNDIFKVALLGYTNAGKSSLMNALTDSEIFVEDRLFATLDPTVRLLSETGKDKILLVDTVGFIRKLPHHLVASFKSTLEESQDADLLLHVIDCTHTFFRDQMQVVKGVKKDLKIDDRPVITALNKIDLIEDKTILRELKQEFDPCFLISAKRNMFVEDLKQEIIRQVRQQKITANIRMKITEQKRLASIYQWAEVLNKEYEDGFVRLEIQFPGNKRGWFYKLIEDGVAVEEK
ncbi:GTPase HflX [candidate division KSB1 bacterium]|nr:GTPase HflX [candidate division KSB1 bacterium]